MEKSTVASGALVLIAVALGNYALLFALGVVVARSLGPGGWDDYSMAVATVSTLATLAELGLGKYGMRAIPAYVEHDAWSKARGYGRFANLLVLVVAVGLAALAGLDILAQSERLAGRSLGLLLLFLPAIALAGLNADLATANRAILRAAVGQRLLIPAVALLLVLIARSDETPLTPRHAVACYGLGWTVGLVALALLRRRTTPDAVRAAAVAVQPRAWVRAAMPFLLFGLLMSLMSRVNIIILQIIDPQEVAGFYAAAFQIGSFIYLVAQSSDKFFLPLMSTLIERGDTERMWAIRGRRLLVIGTLCAAFMLVMFFFGRSLLAIYGPEFRRAYWALLIIAGATALSTFWSLSPTFLNYMQLNKQVVLATGVAVAVNVLLCWQLGSRYGETGGAAAYGISLALLYIFFQFAAQRTLRNFSAEVEPIEPAEIEPPSIT